MPVRSAFFRTIFALVLLAQGTHAKAETLGAFNAEITESSVSGISSGAFMAVQFGTAWASIVKGVGVIAGGPYFCAEGTAVAALSGENLRRATGSCMAGLPVPPVRPLIDAADAWAHSKDIDPTSHLAAQRIYLFSGYNDAVVAQAVTDAARRFYLHYLTEGNRGQVYYQHSIGAGHAQVTVDYGAACQKNAGDFINACGYDQAGVLLQHIYGALAPKSAGALRGRLLEFSQRDFTRPASPASYSLAETGYVYVPDDCARQEPCRVHVALHGCKQYAGLIGDHYVRHAGYNEWADTNRIIVLYPQTIAGDPMSDFGTPFNPNGCWDWWGYTDARYATKSGRQTAAIKAMLDRLTEATRPARARSLTGAVAAAVTVTDTSEDSVALAWTDVAGAQAYIVSRATGKAGAFTLVGTTEGQSFADSGLSPETVYRYRVTATVKDERGPVSDMVVAKTRPVPPRCNRPGSCKLSDAKAPGRE